MIPAIIGVAAIAVCKMAVSSKTEQAIKYGQSKAKNKVIAHITAKQTSQFISILINVLAFLFAVYVVPFFSKDWAIGIICMTYLSSVMYSILNFFYFLLEIRKFIFNYKFNLRGFLYNKIYFEVIKEVDKEKYKLSLFENIFDKLFGKDSHQIAHNITSEATNATIAIIITAAIRMFIAIAVYVGIFSFLIRPLLLEEHTGFSWYQALLYPFLYSIDYAFGTNLVAIIL